MRTTLILLALFALAPLSAAEHCTTYTTSEPEVDLTFYGVPYYFDNDGCWDICSMWVYEETNGIDGLQRGDEVVDDTCHGMIRSDTIIF